MVKKLVGLGAATILMAALVTTASAQTQGGQPGQGGGGRRGGFGGGVGGPGGGGFGQGGFMRRGGQSNHDPVITHVMELIQRSDVQNELHLDLRTKAALKQFEGETQQAMQQQMQQIFQSLRGNRGNRGGNTGANAGNAGGTNGQDPNQQPPAQVDRTAQRQQMQQQMQQLQSDMQTKVNQGLSNILTPAQATRLHQLDLQWRGVLAIADPKVNEELQASQEHAKAITDLVTEYKTKSQEMIRQFFQNMRGNRAQGGGNTPPPGQPNINPQEFRAAIEKADTVARKEAEEKALPILSDAEKTQWTKIQGRPFTFRKDLQIQPGT